MITAAAIDTNVALRAIGVRQDRGTASSPSRAAITLHSRSAGAFICSSAIAVNSLAVFDMAA